MNAHTLQVPGASLYYERRGSGPLLLLIVGGNGDAGIMEQLATELADQYTVLSYDRRGFSRSRMDEPPDDRRLETDGDDARRVIDMLADGPARVLGSSSGAIVALNLLTRYPDRVHTLVAHEPPLVTLLPNAARHLEFLDQVHSVYRRLGVQAAMEKFNTGVGLDLPALPPGAAMPQRLAETIARIQVNHAYWLEHELRQYPRAVPDLAALKAASARLVLAGGRDSREQFPYLPNTVLAEHLSSDVIDFPGGHVGYATHPAAFAEQLAKIL